MPGIKELTALMKELENLISACSRCGACQSVCPVFTQTRREADVARGKLALLEGLLEEMFNDSVGVSKRLERCLLCGSCELNCSSKVKILEIFIKSRSILTGFTGLPWFKKAIFKQLLSRPKRFDSVAELLSKYQYLLLKPTDKPVGTSCPRLVSPLLTDRHIMPLAPVPFHRMVLPQKMSSRRSGVKVAFFTGCLIDKIFPNVAKASVDALNYHGMEVYIPNVQGCCGIPAVSSGDTESFTQLVMHNIEIFEANDFDFLVTACATCTATIKKIWPIMFKASAKDLKERVEKIANKTYDISQFLVSKVDLKIEQGEKKTDSILATYHDPCHLKKTLGVSREPRQLISANTEYRLIEMHHADQCCGMGGSFNLQHYDISAKIGKQKAENICNSESSVVTTSCPACMIQMSDVLSKSNNSITVKHVIEIYAKGLESV